jgi:RHS repeat-associated protein
VGNRLNETTAKGETAYTYDPANRLTSVNGQAVQWDDNGREAPLGRRFLPPERGNMLADGQAVYKYTSNKLSSVTKGTSTTLYKYSGLGDRIQQTVDGTTTNYTLDINTGTGLTQVLDDGTNKYLYGNQRIAQIAPTQTGYFLPDALGSIRQMTDASADLTLARSYDPYGDVLSSSGSGETIFGYAGEIQDEQGLVYLRARYYDPANIGRFLSMDTWEGDSDQPMDYNLWLYGNADPVNNIDPDGHDAIWLTNENAVPLPGEDNPLIHAGHTSLLVEDGHTGNWYYFYYGPEHGKGYDPELVIVEKVTQTELESINNLNSWLSNPKEDKVYLDHEGKKIDFSPAKIPGGMFTQSVYIQGDFSKSLEHIKEMKDRYLNHGTKYIVFWANCLDNSIQTIELGKFNYQNQNLNFHYRRNVYETTSNIDVQNKTPNGAQKVMEEIFMNNAYTKTGQVSQINAKINEWERLYSKYLDCPIYGSADEADVYNFNIRRGKILMGQDPEK